MAKVLSNYDAPSVRVKISAPTMTADEVKAFYDANPAKHNEDGSTFQHQPQYYDTSGAFHQGGGYLFRRNEVSDPENPGKTKTNYEWIDTTMGSMSHDIKAGHMQKPEFKTPEMIDNEIEMLRGFEQSKTKEVDDKPSGITENQAIPNDEHNVCDAVSVGRTYDDPNVRKIMSQFGADDGPELSDKNPQFGE